MEVLKDPEAYDQRRTPHESADAANEAIRAFFKDVREAATKHQICDAACVCAVRIKYEDRGIGDAVSSIHIGDSLREEQMLAWALGHASAGRREKMAQLLAGKE